MTEYRDVPGFPGYRAGDDGSVWSCFVRTGLGTWAPSGPWVQMHPSTAATGYKQVVLRRGGKKINVLVHRAVLASFRGAMPRGVQARHLDGTRDNNALENLAWGSASDNWRDMDRHGRARRGESHHSSKFTAATVRDARARWRGGESVRSISRALGIGRCSVRSAVNGTTWSHIQ